jgi:hypothetical protein
MQMSGIDGHGKRHEIATSKVLFIHIQTRSNPDPQKNINCRQICQEKKAEVIVA